MSGATGRASTARPTGQTQFVRGTRNLVALAVILIGAAGALAAGRVFTATGLTAPAKDPLPRNKLDAVTVTFDAHPTKMVFRAPWQVTLDLGRGVRYGNGYAETFDNKNCQGCCEVCQDGRQQYSRMWIAHRSAARIVVRWRAALADKNGTIAHIDVPSGSPHGKGDWVDEWYTIYPDATHVRLVRIYTGLAPRAGAHWGRPGRHPFETQESTVFGPPGRQPIDDIDVRAVTVIAMDGRHARHAWKPYPRKVSLLPRGNIQVVHLKCKYKPFTITGDDDVAILPYHGPPIDRKHLSQTVFDAWPRIPRFQNGYASALTHVVSWKFHRRTRNTIEQVYLTGITTADTAAEQVRRLLPVAKSWLTPPDLGITSAGYRSLGYDRTRKAYVVRNTADAAGPLDLTLQAAQDRPAINPALVVKGWSGAQPVVTLNGRVRAPGKDLRIGIEKTDDSPDLVIWLGRTFTRPVRIGIRLPFAAAPESP